MTRSPDYYEALGVHRDATDDEIRKAYRRLAREYHPDVNQSPDAAQRFGELSEAYEILSDPEKRKSYDRFGHAGAKGHPGQGGPGQQWGGGPDVGDLGSIFEEMFGGGRGASPFGTAGRTQSGPRPRGQDIEHDVTVTFMTAVTGGEEHIRLKASGGGDQTVKVKIPAGIDSGSRLRVKGQGGRLAQDGPPGDLILTVMVGAHPRFRREGLDLLVDVPIGIADAALGITVDVPLVQGTAHVKIPPGASSGQKLRIRGQGIRDSKGNQGDLYAVVQITAPASLSPHARELMEALREELQNPSQTGPWADT